MPRHLQLYRPDHPRATTSGCVWAHVDIAEKALGRLMPIGAEVHHVDGNSHNNANSNLVICQDKAFHKLLHVRARIVHAGGDPNSQKICATCKRVRNLEDFNRATANRSLGRQQQCRDCSHAYAKTYQRRSCQASAI